MHISPLSKDNAPEWARLCCAPWPDHTPQDMLDAFFARAYQNEFLYRENGLYAAFISLPIRKKYVEGKTDANPAGYLEGMYVRPQFRRKEVGLALVGYAKQWAAKRGLSMIASDCQLCNEQSRLFHARAGFQEASINVHFTMNLQPGQTVSSPKYI